MTNEDSDEYEGRLQSLLQRSRKVRKSIDKANTEELDTLLKESDKIQRELTNLLCELEVEDFLIRGPMGEDPK